MDERTKTVVDFLRLGRYNGQTHEEYHKANEVGELIDALERGDLLIVPGWQPIETAPKDGNPVEVWASGIVMTGYYGTYHPNSPGKPKWRDLPNRHAILPTSWRPKTPSPQTKEEPR